jgi:hypothetical protein
MTSIRHWFRFRKFDVTDSSCVARDRSGFAEIAGFSSVAEGYPDGLIHFSRLFLFHFVLFDQWPNKSPEPLMTVLSGKKLFFKGEAAYPAGRGLTLVAQSHQGNFQTLAAQGRASSDS